MRAFQNTTVTKPQIIAQLEAHALADDLVKGQYWEDGKGCAVGCTIHGIDHAEYEHRFGIPQMLARLEDAIFEGLPNEEAKAWPLRFMNSVQPGADLSRVGWQFLHWLLTDSSVNPGIDDASVRDAIKQCADVILPLTKGEKVNESAARSAARSAAWSAESAVWSAVSATCAATCAARSAAMSAVWSAESAVSAARSAANAESAVWSAESAVWSAVSATCAARSAARSAVSAARSAESAVSAASAAYVTMANKLIALIATA